MTSEITAFDKNGNYLDVLTSGVATVRGWCLNDFERCEWEMSTRDPHCTERNTRMGNLVRVAHIPNENPAGSALGHLPDWYGVILPPYFWNEAAGTYKLTAYSLEYILQFRPMPYVHVKGTQAKVFRDMLNYANRIRGTFIHPGHIEDDKEDLPTDLSLSMYEHLKDMEEQAGIDWSVTGDIDASGRLQAYANLYHHKGRYTRQVLRTGVNVRLKDQIVTGQGEIVNHVFGYAGSFEAGMKPREARDPASISKYGEWAKNEIFSSQTGGLQQAARTSLAKSKEPQAIINVVALNSGSTFSYLDTGHTWDVAVHDAGFFSGQLGFTGQARILSMKYDDLPDEVDLKVELL